jgi:uncharacterized protein (DUF305 family)
VKMSSARWLLIDLLAVAALAGCGGAARAPAPPPAPAGAQTEAAPTIAVVEQRGVPENASVGGGARRGYSAADVRFMQRMIGHHGQALTMTALVPSRTQSEAIRMLADRISVSQRDEMAMMRRWLEARHEEVPMDAMATDAMATDARAMDAMPMGDHGLMPGMLTEAELATLAAATGAAFDGLFLQDMIRHHEGALTMVASLFGSTGAAQEPELFRLASDVDADQRAEIARMRALLATMPARK